MQSNVRPETMARITTLELANAFIDEQVAEVRAQVGDKKVLLALSGGVDSSVVAAGPMKGKQGGMETARTIKVSTRSGCQGLP